MTKLSSKGPKPLLWAGLQVAPVKVTIYFIRIIYSNAIPVEA